MSISCNFCIPIKRTKNITKFTDRSRFEDKNPSNNQLNMKRSEVMAIKESDDSKLCKKLSEITKLEVCEVEALFERFKKIVGRSNLMNRSSFRDSLGILGLTSDDWLPSRIFKVFDIDNDGFLSFPEYLVNLSVMLRGTEDEKLELSFLFSADEDSVVRIRSFEKLVNSCQMITKALVIPGTAPREAQLLYSNELIKREFFNYASFSDGDTFSMDLDDYKTMCLTSDWFLMVLGILPFSREIVLDFQNENLNLKIDGENTASLREKTENHTNFHKTIFKSENIGHATKTQSQSKTVENQNLNANQNFHENQRPSVSGVLNIFSFCTTVPLICCSVNYESYDHSRRSDEINLKNSQTHEKSSKSIEVNLPAAERIQSFSQKFGNFLLPIDTGVRDAKLTPTHSVVSELERSNTFERSVSPRGGGENTQNLKSFTKLSTRKFNRNNPFFQKNVHHVQHSSPNSSNSEVSPSYSQRIFSSHKRAVLKMTPPSLTGKVTDFQKNENNNNFMKSPVVQESTQPGNPDRKNFHNKRKKLLLKQKKNYRLLGPKRGLAVHFGHENWNMVINFF